MLKINKILKQKSGIYVYLNAIQRFLENFTLFLSAFDLIILFLGSTKNNITGSRPWLFEPNFQNRFTIYLSSNVKQYYMEISYFHQIYKKFKNKNYCVQILKNKKIEKKS